MKKEIIERNKPELDFNETMYAACTDLKFYLSKLDYAVRNVADGFIMIGYYLKAIRDSKAFTELGFKDIYEFAESKYQFSKTSVKNFISVSERFGNKDTAHLERKYENYNFSQLVELVSEDEESLAKYSPAQTVKEIRLTKFENKYDENCERLLNWIQKDVVSFLKKKYPQSKVFCSPGSVYPIKLNYKNMVLEFYNSYHNGIIEIFCYDLSPFFKEKTIFSLKMIEMSVNRFIKRVDEKCVLKEEAVSPTSDRKEVKVIDALPEKEQILKNDKMRESFIRDSNNYDLLYDLTEVNAKIYRNKEIPEIFEIQWFGKSYGTDQEMAWHHGEWHLVKEDPEFGRAMFHSTSISMSGLVNYLKEIKY